MILLLRLRLCSRVGRLVVQRVNDLTGTGVVQTLAGFMLDGVRIILQVIDVILHPGVFILQLLDLLLQRFVFYALLLVCGDAVLPEYDVIAEEDRQKDGGRCSKATAHAISKAGGSDQVRVLYGLFHNNRVSEAKPLLFYSGTPVKPADAPICLSDAEIIPAPSLLLLYLTVRCRSAF